jgi:hypothetical protein
MFGLRGKGRASRGYNLGGIKCGRNFCRYNSLQEGIDSVIKLHCTKYAALPLNIQQRRWVGYWDSKYYHDLLRTIILLTEYYPQ